MIWDVLWLTVILFVAACLVAVLLGFWFRMKGPR